MSNSEKISLEQLEAMFAQIRDESPWDPTGDLTWGYYFVDADIDKLEQAGLALEEQGYTLLGILEPDDSDEAVAESEVKDMYFLHVVKVETHTPESLSKRNDELYAFAAQHSLFSYDGMDVGPVEDLLEDEIEPELEEE